jgi:hypothetical protein
MILSFYVGDQWHPNERFNAVHHSPPLAIFPIFVSRRPNIDPEHRRGFDLTTLLDVP